jgi:Zn-dependent M28 family amino/carboxypeptidase
MIAAHIDSWHSATGATDDGTGSAVMIEVMRILTALHVRNNDTVGGPAATGKPAVGTGSATSPNSVLAAGLDFDGAVRHVP